MATPDKTRDTTNTPGVAENRADIIKNVVKRFNKAMKDEFYLEAVCLCESLICDRLESRIGALKNDKDMKFGMLSDLVKLLTKHNESNKDILACAQKINSDWRPKRNKVIHEAAKISKTQPKKWNKFIADAKVTAEDGYTYFRELDKLVTKERRKSGK